MNLLSSEGWSCTRSWNVLFISRSSQSALHSMWTSLHHSAKAPHGWPACWLELQGAPSLQLVIPFLCCLCLWRNPALPFLLPQHKIRKCQRSLSPTGLRGRSLECDCCCPLLLFTDRPSVSCNTCSLNNPFVQPLSFIKVPTERRYGEKKSELICCGHRGLRRILHEHAVCFSILCSLLPLYFFPSYF